jgi:hypothetical protein
VTFRGFITVDGPTEVTYVVTGPFNPNPQPQTLLFKEAGTQEITASLNIQETTDGRAILRVTAPNSIETQAPAGSFSVTCQSRFKLIFKGFKVNHKTGDDIFEHDGAGDEVFSYVSSFVVDSSGSVVWQARNRAGQRIGDTNRGNAIQGGGASDTGGFDSQNVFPDRRSYAAQHAVEVASGSNDTAAIPGVVFDGVIAQRRNAAVVFVSLWEWDDDDSPLYQDYVLMLANAPFAQAIPQLIPQVNSYESMRIILKTGSELRMNRRVQMGFGPIGRGVPNSRPIGMRTGLVEDGFAFEPQAIILTFENAQHLANSRTPFEVRYVDSPALEGDYTLFFEVTYSR